MAGEWIPVSVGLTRTVEVVQIVRLLSGAQQDRNRHEVSGLLIEFWSWASAQTADGRIKGVTLADLVQIIGGDEAFWRAVCAVGWLVVDDDGLVVPNADRWLSNGAKARLLDSRRKAASRKRCAHAAPKSSGSCPGGVRDLSGAQPDKNRTREEYRREEKNTPPTPPEGGGGGKESDRADRAAGDEQATGDAAARLVVEFYGAWRGEGAMPEPRKLPPLIAGVGQRIERHGVDLVRRAMRALPARLQGEFPTCREGLPAAWKLLDRIIDQAAAEVRLRSVRDQEAADRDRQEAERAAEAAEWRALRPTLLHAWRGLAEHEREAILAEIPGRRVISQEMLLDECLRRMRDGGEEVATVEAADHEG